MALAYHREKGKAKSRKKRDREEIGEGGQTSRSGLGFVTRKGFRTFFQGKGEGRRIFRQDSVGKRRGGKGKGGKRWGGWRATLKHAGYCLMDKR